MQSIQLTNLDVDALRTRLRKMSDEELRKFGKAARYMVSPRANMEQPAIARFCAAVGGGSRRMAQEIKGTGLSSASDPA